MNFIRRYAFKKAVRSWCIKIRLYRELVKEIKKLQAESMSNDLVARLNLMALELFMPDYRQLDDELRNEHIKRLLNRRCRLGPQQTRMT